MSKNLKKILILLIILCIIISIILVLLVFELKKDNFGKNNSIEETESLSDAYEYDKNKVSIVKLRNDFFIVQECIETFYNNYLIYNSSGENPEKVYNLLDSEYIKQTSINENNLKNKFGNYNNIEIDITDMYNVQVGIGKNVYFVYGYLIDIESNKVSDLSIGVKVDNTNRTFSILPYEYLEKKGFLNITEESKIELDEIDDIENKTYNAYKSSYPNDELYVNKLFENYINRVVYNTELAYKSLDVDYSKNRFGNLQNYKNFIEKYRDIYLSYNMQNAKTPEDFGDVQEYLLYLSTFQKIELESYKVTTEKDYKQYVCIDNFDNYYIFRENSPMKYTLILDTYTLDLPEFIEKYDAGNDEEKLKLNVNKIIEAVNYQDYGYIYNKINETFKNNNFNNINKFENYIKNNFYNKNNITNLTYKQEGDVYICTLTISNKENNQIGNKSITILMRLLENRDFEISFSV